jgi:hypothetical protein
VSSGWGYEDAEEEVRNDQQQGRLQNGAAGEPLISRALFWPELVKLPRPKYLVKGVVDVGNFVEIFGPSQSYKSFIAIDLGLHIAQGWRWRGRRVQQRGVLYVSAEGGTAVINRMEAWARHHQIDLADVNFAVVLAATNLLHPSGVPQVIADASRVPNLGLICVDTASRVMPGGAEDTRDMSEFVKCCDDIRAETESALAAVHHTGKSVERGSRGSSVLPGAIDAALSVTKDEDTKIATAEVVKVRDGETGAKFQFKLEVVELDTDGDGDPIRSGVVIAVADDGTPRRAETGKAKLTGAARVGLEQLRNCMADNSVEMPVSAHIPAGFRGVTLAYWRGYLEKAGVINTEGNPREQFRRIRVTLQERGFIGVWDDFVWLSHPVT